LRAETRAVTLVNIGGKGRNSIFSDVVMVRKVLIRQTL
jgi:hypothetical protein